MLCLKLMRIWFIILHINEMLWNIMIQMNYLLISLLVFRRILFTLTLSWDNKNLFTCLLNFKACQEQQRKGSSIWASSVSLALQFHRKMRLHSFLQSAAASSLPSYGRDRNYIQASDCFPLSKTQFTIIYLCLCLNALHTTYWCGLDNCIAIRSAAMHLGCIYAWLR